MIEITTAPTSRESVTEVQRTPADVAAAMVAAFAARTERAADIVRRGAVEAVDHGRYRVQSAGAAGYFSVREGYCNCPDFAWRGIVPCKHLIAVEITRALSTPE